MVDEEIKFINKKIKKQIQLLKFSRNSVLQEIKEGSILKIKFYNFFFTFQIRYFLQTSPKKKEKIIKN